MDIYRWQRRQCFFLENAKNPEKHGLLRWQISNQFYTVEISRISILTSKISQASTIHLPFIYCE